MSRQPQHNYYLPCSWWISLIMEVFLEWSPAEVGGPPCNKFIYIFFNMASISWVADSPLWRMFSRFVFALVGPESSSSNIVASTADHSPWLIYINLEIFPCCYHVLLLLALLHLDRWRYALLWSSRAWIDVDFVTSLCRAIIHWTLWSTGF